MYGSKLKVKYDHKRRSGKSLDRIWTSAALLIWTDLQWVRRAVGAERVGLPGLTLKHHSPVLTVVELAGGSERVRSEEWGVRSEDLLPGQHATSGYNLNIPPSQHNLQQINHHPALQKIHYPTYYLRDNKIAVKTIFNCMIYFFVWILTLF